MLKINIKEIVLKQIERSKQYSQLSKQEKINIEFDNIKFELEMLRKHGKGKFDKKHCYYNIWTIISRIESIKNKKE